MTTDSRLIELVQAAEALITEGSTAANRRRLQAALAAIPSELDGASLFRPLQPTPAMAAVLQRAVELANASNDLHLRTHHLEFALKEITPA